VGIKSNKMRSGMAISIRKYTPRGTQKIDDTVGESKGLTCQDANQIIADARIQAEQIREQALMEAETKSAKYLTELMGKAKREVAQFERKARAEMLRELDQCAGVINEAKSMLQQLGNVSHEAIEKDRPYLNVFDEKTETGELASGEESLYQGEVELEVKSSGDFGQVARFLGCLRAVPDIELKSLGTYVQGKSTAVVLDITEPLRLLEILMEIPTVKEVFGNGNNIKLVLK
jgi:vacuolar-type H+-ATPase subunit H